MSPRLKTSLFVYFIKWSLKPFPAYSPPQSQPQSYQENLMPQDLVSNKPVPNIHFFFLNCIHLWTVKPIATKRLTIVSALIIKVKNPSAWISHLFKKTITQETPHDVNTLGCQKVSIIKPRLLSSYPHPVHYLPAM